MRTNYVAQAVVIDSPLCEIIWCDHPLNGYETVG